MSRGSKIDTDISAQCHIFDARARENNFPAFSSVNRRIASRAFSRTFAHTIAPSYGQIIIGPLIRATLLSPFQRRASLMMKLAIPGE